MKTLTKDSPIIFHIGRGGRFHNQGHLTCVGIGDRDRQDQVRWVLDKLFPGYEDEGKFSNHPEFLTCLTGDCIVDCIHEGNFERLETVFGIEEVELGDQGYFDGNGCYVVSKDDINSNDWRVEMDGDYDTTYCTTLEQLDADEISVLQNCNNYYRDDAIEVLIELGKVEKVDTYVIAMDCGAMGTRYVSDDNSDYGCADINDGHVLTFLSEDRAEEYILNHSFVGQVEKRN